MSTPSVDEIVARGGDADDVLRAVVSALHEEAGYSWAAILFVEESELVTGPSAGRPGEAERTSVPVVWQGLRVAELAVEGAANAAFLEHVAGLVSAHCLVGWDTGGASWDA
jgi:hypothetical protein